MSLPMEGMIEFIIINLNDIPDTCYDLFIDIVHKYFRLHVFYITVP